MPEFEEILHEQIDNYLTGRMTATEKSDFEAKIAGDPLLREEVEFQKKVMAAIKHARKQELKDFIKTSARAENRNKLTRPIWLSAAAAILIISMVGIYFFRSNNLNTEDNLALQKDALEAPPAQADVQKDTDQKISDSGEIILKNENGKLAEQKPSYTTLPKNALVQDTVLYATVIESKNDEEIDKVAGSKLSVDDEIKVELYKAADNEIGYIFFNNKLKIYGFVTDVQRIELKHFEGNLYMNYGLETYQLMPQNKLNKFVPVRNELILRKIGVKMERSN